MYKIVYVKYGLEIVILSMKSSKIANLKYSGVSEGVL